MIDKDLSDLKFIAFDFDGVFTDNSVYVDENGVESVRCSRFDGIGLEKLKKLNIELAILSSETNPLVLKRAKKLNINCQNSIKDKAAELEKNISRLKIAQHSVAVADCHPDIDKYIDFKLSKSGGHGAVRELCDLIYLNLFK